MGMTSFVHLVTQVEGLHHWPDAQHPDRYLRAPHRHLFVVTAQVEVFDHDREIEINAAARWLHTTVAAFGEPVTGAVSLVDFAAHSCERIAARAAQRLADHYGRHRRIRCTVLEDGVLGAGVTWRPPRTVA